jgi:hypothetical protein
MVLGSGIRDPGSGKNLFRIPDPGVKKAPDPGSGSATLEKSTGFQIWIRNIGHKSVLLLLLYVLENSRPPLYPPCSVVFLPCHLFSHFLAVIYKTF